MKRLIKNIIDNQVLKKQEWYKFIMIIYIKKVNKSKLWVLKLTCMKLKYIMYIYQVKEYKLEIDRL